MEGTKPVIIIINMEGTRPNAADYGGHNAYKSYKYGGHPAPAGRALPNLLMRSEC